MTEHKGMAETVQLNPTDYKVGDYLEVEVGDWNGSGYSYKQNGNAKMGYLVVEVADDALTVVNAEDQLDYRTTGNRDLEVEIQEGGWVETPRLESWNARLKEVEVVPGMSGEHKVKAGIEKGE